MLATEVGKRMIWELEQALEDGNSYGHGNASRPGVVPRHAGTSRVDRCHYMDAFPIQDACDNKVEKAMCEVGLPSGAQVVAQEDS